MVSISAAGIQARVAIKAKNNFNYNYRKAKYLEASLVNAVFPVFMSRF
jgi:hypothetical protein